MSASIASLLQFEAVSRAAWVAVLAVSAWRSTRLTPDCTMENELPALSVQPLGVAPANVSWTELGCDRVVGSSNTQAWLPHAAITRRPLIANSPIEAPLLATSVAACT